MGPRELRKQLAYIAAVLYNANRKAKTQPLEMEDFLLRTVEQSAQQQFDRMLATLSAVAVTRPPGYKRKRPRQPGERERSQRKKPRP